MNYQDLKNKIYGTLLGETTVYHTGFFFKDCMKDTPDTAGHERFTTWCAVMADKGEFSFRQKKISGTADTWGVYEYRAKRLRNG